MTLLDPRRPARAAATIRPAQRNDDRAIDIPAALAFAYRNE